MIDRDDGYQELGRYVQRLTDKSFADSQGFSGGEKQLSLVRQLYARAASRKLPAAVDLGRVIYDNFSPRSGLAKSFDRFHGSVRGRT